MSAPSRNPYAARAAAVLTEGGDPWQGEDARAEHASALALIGLTDELRRANQIALAQALGDHETLTALAARLDVTARGAATAAAA